MNSPESGLLERSPIQIELMSSWWLCFFRSLGKVMTSKTPSEAVENYKAPLQRALSCITDGELTIQRGAGGGYVPSEDPHVIVLNEGSPVILKGAAELGFRAIQQYRIVQDGDLDRRSWKTVVVGYVYAIDAIDEITRERGEVVAYHWHPLTQTEVLWPHVHIGQGAVGNAARIGERYIHKIHFPTGQVSLEEVIRLLIREFQVPVRREDWEQVLAETLAAHRTDNSR